MSLTLIIIIVTTLVSVLAFSDINLRNKLVFSPYMINVNKEFHRFLTSGFIHADWQHLIFNMLTLYFFGENVERIFLNFMGDAPVVKFLVLYLGGMVFADVYSYFKHKNNPYYSALGASGAVSAILFSAILFDPWSILMVNFFIPVPAVLFGVGYLWYSAKMSKQGGDNIGHDAHLYGAIFGVIATIALNPKVVLIFFDSLMNPSFL